MVESYPIHYCLKLKELVAGADISNPAIWICKKLMSLP